MFNFSRTITAVFKKAAQFLGYGKTKTSEGVTGAREISRSVTEPPTPESLEPPEQLPDYILSPEWVGIVSSYVTSVKYEQSIQKLSVTYLHKKVCRYSGISLEQFVDFLSSASKGRWARTHLFSKPYD